MRINLGLDEIVIIMVGISTVCAFLYSCYKVMKKVDLAINRNCPCETVKDLEEESLNGKRRIKTFDAEVAGLGRKVAELNGKILVVNSEIVNIQKTINRVDANVLEILKSNIF